MEISISGVNSPIPNLYPYVQHADLESEAGIEKLNTLDARIRGMAQEEQRLFSGALELERSGSLDDAVRIAYSLEQYDILPKIKTDEDLGRFLVDTAFMTGKFSFPEEARPYLDYSKIGAERRDSLGRDIHTAWPYQVPERIPNTERNTKYHSPDAYDLGAKRYSNSPRL